MDDPLGPLERLRRHSAGGDPALPPARRAAVAAVLRLGELGPEALLMCRSVREEDPWSGQISLPGGRTAGGDADLLATAVREAREEVGLDLAADAELLCRLAAQRARARDGVLDMDVTPFVFHLIRPAVAVPDLVEARAVFWLPLALAARGGLDDVVPCPGDAGLPPLPAWRFGEHVVWGMTHAMLTRLLAAAGL